MKKNESCNIYQYHVYPRRFLFFQQILGFFLNFLGLLLPWAVEKLYVLELRYLGFQMMLGFYVLIGTISALIFLFLYRKRGLGLWLGLTFLSTLITLFSSLTCIVNPVLVVGGTIHFQSDKCQVVYGVYVSLIGSAIASSSIIFELISFKRDQEKPKSLHINLVDKIFIVGAYLVFSAILIELILLALNIFPFTVVLDLYLKLLETTFYGCMLLIASIIYISLKKISKASLIKRKRQYF
jgi:hypothetical protein